MKKTKKKQTKKKHSIESKLKISLAKSKLSIGLYVLDNNLIKLLLIK